MTTETLMTRATEATPPAPCSAPRSLAPGSSPELSDKQLPYGIPSAMWRPALVSDA